MPFITVPINRTSNSRRPNAIHNSANQPYLKLLIPHQVERFSYFVDGAWTFRHAGTVAMATFLCVILLAVNQTSTLPLTTATHSLTCLRTYIVRQLTSLRWPQKSTCWQDFKLANRLTRQNTIVTFWFKSWLNYTTATSWRDHYLCKTCRFSCA